MISGSDCARSRDLAGLEDARAARRLKAFLFALTVAFRATDGAQSCKRIDFPNWSMRGRAN
jgi:hypothetical protein